MEEDQLFPLIWALYDDKTEVAIGIDDITEAIPDILMQILTDGRMNVYISESRADFTMFDFIDTLFSPLQDKTVYLSISVGPDSPLIISTDQEIGNVCVDHFGDSHFQSATVDILCHLISSVRIEFTESIPSTSSYPLFSIGSTPPDYNAEKEEEFNQFLSTRTIYEDSSQLTTKRVALERKNRDKMQRSVRSRKQLEERLKTAKESLEKNNNRIAALSERAESNMEKAPKKVPTKKIENKIASIESILSECESAVARLSQLCNEKNKPVYFTFSEEDTLLKDLEQEIKEDRDIISTFS